MVKKMTKEEKALIYEFVGFKYANKCDDIDDWWYGMDLYTYPNETSARPLPELDMNFYTERVIPYLWICNLTTEEGLFYVWTLGHPNHNNSQVVKSSALEDITEAFGQALLKLIRSNNEQD